MDTQDIVAWGKLVPEWMFNEVRRLSDLCAWGQKFGLDGFVRYSAHPCLCYPLLKEMLEWKWTCEPVRPSPLSILIFEEAKSCYAILRRA